MNTASNASRNVVFLFPAHGSEHMGMSKGLYAYFPCYREAFDCCADYLLDYLDVDLRHLIAPPQGRESSCGKKSRDNM
jgi:acyl transferase domain-containing protein